MVLFPHIKLSMPKSLPRSDYLNKLLWPMDWGTIWKKIIFLFNVDFLL